MTDKPRIAIFDGKQHHIVLSGYNDSYKAEEDRLWRMHDKENDTNLAKGSAAADWINAAA